MVATSALYVMQVSQWKYLCNALLHVQYVTSPHTHYTILYSLHAGSTKTATPTAKYSTLSAWCLNVKMRNGTWMDPHGSIALGMYVDDDEILYEG
jgi:hypothetical protein